MGVVARLPSQEMITDERGAIRMWCPAPGVFASEVTGLVPTHYARAFTAFGDRVLEMGLPVIGLHDWCGVDGYEPETRRVLTPWTFSNIERFEVIHVALRSRVVKMGVAIANVTLGGRISSTLDLDRFRSTYEATVAARS